MARNTFSIITFGFALVAVSEAYQAGAPTGVCDSLTPQHGVNAQTSAFPYSLITTKKGNQIIVSLKTKTPSDSFKGFILEVRDASGKPIGTFNTPPDTKSVDCTPGKKNALTHSSSKEKKEIRTTWTAPPNFVGSVYAIATVARDGGTFWVGEKSTEVQIESRRH